MKAPYGWTVVDGKPVKVGDMAVIWDLGYPHFATRKAARTFLRGRRQVKVLETKGNWRLLQLTDFGDTEVQVDVEPGQTKRVRFYTLNAARQFFMARVG